MTNTKERTMTQEELEYTCLNHNLLKVGSLYKIGERNTKKYNFGYPVWNDVIMYIGPAKNNDGGDCYEFYGFLKKDKLKFHFSLLGQKHPTQRDLDIEEV